MNSFKMSLILILGMICSSAFAADAVLQNDRLLLGKPSAANKSILFRLSTSTTTQPTVRYNNSNSFMEFSNDGTTFQQFNPMTSGGQLLYGGASGVLTALDNGTSGQVLSSQGTTAAPAWLTLSTQLPPIIRTFGSGSGTFNLSYVFTVSSASATVTATYTNNAQTCTVEKTIASATKLVASCTGDPLASGTLTKASGTGDATITFTVWSSPKWLTIKLQGAGGGGGGVTNVTNGAGGGGGAGAYCIVVNSPAAAASYSVGAGVSGGTTAGTDGTTGNSTTFGSYTASGGVGGTGATSAGIKAGGAGGTCTGTDSSTTGATGLAGSPNGSQGVGGAGASSVFGNGGSGGENTVMTPQAGSAKGSGGGGGGANAGAQAGASSAGGAISVEEGF